MLCVTRQLQVHLPLPVETLSILGTFQFRHSAWLSRRPEGFELHQSFGRRATQGFHIRVHLSQASQSGICSLLQPAYTFSVDYHFVVSSFFLSCLKLYHFFPHTIVALDDFASELRLTKLLHP